MPEQNRINELKALQALADGAEKYASILSVVNFPALIIPGDKMRAADMNLVPGGVDDIQVVRIYGWAKASASRWGFMFTDRDPATLALATILASGYEDSPTFVFMAGPAGTEIPIIDKIGLPPKRYRYVVVFDEEEIKNLELTLLLERANATSNFVYLAGAI